MPDPTPTELKQVDARTLGIRWRDGHESVYDVRELRLHCRCANCVDEVTGASRIDPASVPADVYPLAMKQVGRYAFRFDWSDGHSSGIYPFERLRALCGCAECRKAR